MLAARQAHKGTNSPVEQFSFVLFPIVTYCHPFRGIRVLPSPAVW